MKKSLVESVLTQDRDQVVALKDHLLKSMQSAIVQFSLENMDEAKAQLDDVELLIQRMEHLHDKKIVHEKASRQLQSSVQKAVNEFAESTGNHDVVGFDLTFLMKGEQK